jgi:hypothetical protein
MGDLFAFPTISPGRHCREMARYGSAGPRSSWIKCEWKLIPARGRKTGKRESPKPRNRANTPSPASPLAFVLNIVVDDLQAVISECNEDLVPDRHARLGIAAPELLHHVFRHLS